jgi:hypothetical protein
MKYYFTRVTAVILLVPFINCVAQTQDMPKSIVRDGAKFRLADKPLYIDPVYNGQQILWSALILTQNNGICIIQVAARMCRGLAVFNLFMVHRSG